MRFTSHDVGEVESTWRQFVPSAALQGVDPRRFRFDWRSTELGTAALVRYELDARIHSIAEPEDQILVCRVDGPDARIWSGRDVLDARAPWLTDGTRVEAQWDRAATVRALVFDRAEAEARARQLTGDDAIDLRARGLAPVSGVFAERWERMFRYLDEAATENEAESPLLSAEWERHALMVTLSAFPTSAAAALQRPAQRSAAPLTVRRALAYIDANAHRPITVDDVASASYISTRGLQYAFRRALDVTPTEVLRRARLEGARADLEKGDDSASVATIGRRWGFSHPSRFAAAYRMMYGVAPATVRYRARQ